MRKAGAQLRVRNGMPQDFFFQSYCVVLVDLLGQKTRLRHMKDLPSKESDREWFIEVARQTAGTVVFLRDSFRDFFTEALSISDVPSEIPTEKREKFRRLREARVLQHGFSDLITLAVPLSIDGGAPVPMNGVWAVLFAACGMSLLSLSIDRPLRGGVDIGVGTQLGTSGEIYGAVTERAYFIESDLAEYPRVVVGEELLRYVQHAVARSPRTLDDKWAAVLATKCSKFLIQDTDGRWMLDFMGPGVKEVAGDSLPAETVAKAYAFAQGQRERSLKDGDLRLAARYFRLLRYMNHRMPIWTMQGEAP